MKGSIPVLNLPEKEFIVDELDKAMAQVRTFMLAAPYIHETLKETEEMVAKQKEMLTKQKEMLTKKEETITKLNEDIVKLGSEHGRVIVKLGSEHGSVPSSSTAASSPVPASSIKEAEGPFVRGEKYYWMYSRKTPWDIFNGSPEIKLENGALIVASAFVGTGAGKGTHFFKEVKEGEMAFLVNHFAQLKGCALDLGDET